VHRQGKRVQGTRECFPEGEEKRSRTSRKRNTSYLFTRYRSIREGTFDALGSHHEAARAPSVSKRDLGMATQKAFIIKSDVGKEFGMRLSYSL